MAYWDIDFMGLQALLHCHVSLFSSENQPVQPSRTIRSLFPSKVLARALMGNSACYNSILQTRPSLVQPESREVVGPISESQPDWLMYSTACAPLPAVPVEADVY